MDERDSTEPGRWWEFERFVREILTRTPGISLPRTDAINSIEGDVPADQRFDVVAERDGHPLLIEIKSQTPQTRSRLRSTIVQLHADAERYRQTHLGPSPDLVAVFPGVLSQSKLDLVEAEKVQVWDGRYLQRQARQLGVAVPTFVATLEGEERADDREPADELRRRLGRIAPGRDDSLSYEKFCEEALSFLFCPPLNTPISQSHDDSHTNRRDLILPNYATRGFWHFMHNNYHADYVVVEAKNLTDRVGKNEVLQLANYLSRHGTGLVGLIMTRIGMGTSARWTSREQWVLHDKLIVSLNDDDIRQMLLSKQSGTEPSEVVQQRIEDFRLRI